MAIRSMPDSADARHPDPLTAAADEAIDLLGLPTRTRVTGVNLPDRVRHNVTYATAEDWTAFDRLLARDGWQHRIEPTGDPQRPAEYKTRQVLDGRMSVNPPLHTPRPSRMLCPECGGERQKVVAFLRRVDERPEPCIERCGTCEGDGHVRRPIESPESAELGAAIASVFDGLDADDPADIPF